MEKHGVTFKDYALAGANLANGMGLDQICQILGIEEPIWAEIQEFFINSMGQMEPGGEEMMFYATVFTNPKQGKFANVEGAAGGVEDVLVKYPEWSDFLKMQMYSEQASEVGIEIDFDKEFGISVMQFSQLGGHWSAFYKDKVMDVIGFDAYAYEEEGGAAITPEQAERQKVMVLHDEYRDKWTSFYIEKFKGDSIDISDDIDF